MRWTYYGIDLDLDLGEPLQILEGEARGRGKRGAEDDCHPVAKTTSKEPDLKVASA